MERRLFPSRTKPNPDPKPNPTSNPNSNPNPDRNWRSGMSFPKHKPARLGHDADIIDSLSFDPTKSLAWHPDTMLHFNRKEFVLDAVGTLHDRNSDILPTALLAVVSLLHLQAQTPKETPSYTDLGDPHPHGRPSGAPGLCYVSRLSGCD